MMGSIEEDRQRGFDIQFSAFAAPLSSQLKAQKLKFVDVGIRDLNQKLADSLCWLGLHGILTDTEIKSARKRLMKKMGKEIVTAEEKS